MLTEKISPHELRLYLLFLILTETHRKEKLSTGAEKFPIRAPFFSPGRTIRLTQTRYPGNYTGAAPFLMLKEFAYARRIHPT